MRRANSQWLGSRIALGTEKISSLRLGVCKPVILDSNNVILDSVAFVEAAEEVGVEDIYCISIHHLSKAQLRVLRLTLNRLGEKGGWNIEELQFELSELRLEFGLELQIPGFEPGEIDDILRNDNVIGTPDLDSIPPLGQEAITRRPMAARASSPLLR